MACDALPLRGHRHHLGQAHAPGIPPEASRGKGAGRGRGQAVMASTNKIIGVIAPKGSGKSYEVTRRIFAPSPCVALYDPQAARDNDYRIAASEIVEYDLRAAHEVLAQPQFRLLFRPAD